eukprot:6136417-Pyramimonas_sp.AAC.1
MDSLLDRGEIMGSWPPPPFEGEAMSDEEFEYMFGQFADQSAASQLRPASASQDGELPPVLPSWPAGSSRDPAPHGGGEDVLRWLGMPPSRSRPAVTRPAGPELLSSAAAHLGAGLAQLNILHHQ